MHLAQPLIAKSLEQSGSYRAGDFERDVQFVVEDIFVRRAMEQNDIVTAT